MTTPLPGGDRRTGTASVTTLFVTPEGRKLRVRGVRERDLPELHRLDQEVFGEHAYPYFVLRQFYDLYHEDLFVLEDGQAFRGYVLAGTTPAQRRSWILGLAIDEGWRGHGLGRRLMAESLRRLRTQEVREVWLTVEPANDAAIKLYASLGFTRVEYGADYFGEDADRWVMVLPLPAQRA